MWNRLILGKIILFWAYCYICILDFVLYEYSSFSSSQEFFLHFGIWKNHSKSTHFSLILGTKNLVKFGTQQKNLFMKGSDIIVKAEEHILTRLFNIWFPEILVV